MIENFENMNLKPTLLRGIYNMGFEHPSPIQKSAIPVLISGRDILGQGQSGTGKTATFGIGCLQLLDENVLEPQIIILSPTRELAIQTEKVIKDLGNYMNIKIHSLVGGTSVSNDIEILENKVQIIVGTPGRVLHMLQKKHLDLSHLKLVIIDEVDEMLNKGFREQLYTIFQYNLPENVQIGLFSATLPDDIIELSHTFMNNPVNILLQKDQQTLEGIKQYYIIVKNDDEKQHILIKLYSKISISQTIIFTNSRRRVDSLFSKLQKENFTVSVIHGMMDNKERQKIVNKFASGNTRILISTNVLARGIDVQGVSFVINYDVTSLQEKETYIHRIGRCGRYGRKGTVINFINEKEIHIIEQLCEFYNTYIQELPLDFLE